MHTLNKFYPLKAQRCVSTARFNFCVCNGEKKIDTLSILL